MRILVNEVRPMKKFIFYFYFILSKNNENKRENGSQKKNKRENEIFDRFFFTKYLAVK